MRPGEQRRRGADGVCPLQDAGRLDDAKTCLRKALDIAPGHDDAQAHLQHTAALACDWEGQQEGVQALVSTVGRHVTRGEVAACALQPLHALCLPVATETVRARERPAECAAN